MVAGNVKHLDTVHFNEAITAYANYIKQFEEIVRGVNSASNTMLDHWKGTGRNAFEKDCRQIQLNLNDITDIMYDLRDALVNAESEYVKSDAAVSKSFES